MTPTTFADCNAVVAWSAASPVIVYEPGADARRGRRQRRGGGANLQFRGAPGNFIVVQPYEV